MDERIREAAAAWNYIWPRQLESGVMFYKGLRITRDEFESACRQAESGGNWKFA